MMRSMIKFIICLVELITLYSCNQRVNYYLIESNISQRSEIKAQGVLIAQKILKEGCRKDSHPEKYEDGSLHPRKQFGIYEVDSLTIVPITLFKVSLSNGEIYKDKNIVNFLKWEDNNLAGFYTFRDGQFEGLMDWADIVHYNLSKDCFYFTVHNDNSTNEEPYWKGYQYLNEHGRDKSFLFGVKYFIETLWFVENDEVFLLDLKEMKIYDPDKFIRAKCHEGFLEEIANGSQVICNY